MNRHNGAIDEHSLDDGQRRMMEAAEALFIIPAVQA
jgi:hypothetical protein